MDETRRFAEHDETLAKARNDHMTAQSEVRLCQPCSGFHAGTCLALSDSDNDCVCPCSSDIPDLEGLTYEQVMERTGLFDRGRPLPSFDGMYVHEILDRLFEETRSVWFAPVPPGTGMEHRDVLARMLNPMAWDSASADGGDDAFSKAKRMLEICSSPGGVQMIADAAKGCASALLAAPYYYERSEHPEYADANAMERFKKTWYAVDRLYVCGMLMGLADALVAWRNDATECQCWQSPCFPCPRHDRSYTDD